MKFVTVMLFTMLVLLQYRLWIGNGSLTEVHHLQQEKQSILDENGSLKERNDSLAAEVLDLKQGLDAIEERARSEMGMIKKMRPFINWSMLSTLEKKGINQRTCQLACVIGQLFQLRVSAHACRRMSPSNI